MLAPASELPAEFRPLRRDEYDRLVDLGVFEGTKVQLVGGLLVEMTPQKDPHFQLIADLTMLLAPQVQGRHTVSVQGPLQVDDISEPEPDLAILPLPRYRGVGKTGEALLVIEVAESSLRFDLGEKARRYAAAGYPEYWVIDAVGRVLVRHTDPAADGTWGTVERLETGIVRPVAVNAVSIDLGDLFDY
ncbi:Uma2 family endonuclease [soil metagenome]